MSLSPQSRSLPLSVSPLLVRDIAKALGAVPVEQQVVCELDPALCTAKLVTTKDGFTRDFVSEYKVNANNPRIMMIAHIGQTTIVRATSSSFLDNLALADAVVAGSSQLKDGKGEIAPLCHYAGGMPNGAKAQTFLAKDDGTYVHLTAIGYDAIVVDPKNNFVLAFRKIEDGQIEVYSARYKDLKIDTVAKFLKPDEKSSGWIAVANSRTSLKMSDITGIVMSADGGFKLKVYTTDGYESEFSINVTDRGFSGVWSKSTKAAERLIAQPWNLGSTKATFQVGAELEGDTLHIHAAHA